ncbi:RND transporter [Alsobacter metallidurans]|uniref:RND transporter n=1 Tax=Alsobacter metallidurans TaxID=340221 RepID=A0A917I4B5_9HYPH|nr:efflux transporter outer membrane subunit [Alsobacter metallidurans]GGH13040.1 RND transporter [Alsobacter metallidurans]
MTAPRSRFATLRLALAAALAALALAGCLPIEKPDAALDVPSQYRAAKGAPGGAPSRVAWWRSFGSAELTRIMEAVETDNFDIGAAVYRIQQADAQARIAGAALLPTLDASSDASRGRQSGLDRRSLNVALSASYEIDFWGKNRATQIAAERLAAASRFDRDTVALSTLASTATTYFDILGAQDRLKIARESLASATRVLDLIKQRVTVGTGTSLDQAQQETVVAQLRAAIPPLEQQIEQNKATLAVLLGRAPERIAIRGGGTAGVKLPRINPGLPSELLARRPDVGSAEEQLAAASADVTVARAQFFPSIRLTAQGGYESAALSSLFGPGAGFYTLAAGLAQPIFQGGRLEGQLDQARGRESELLEIYRKAVISAFADVERALVAVRQLAGQEELQAQAVESSRRAYQISEQRLREGTVDIVTVLNTQSSLFGSQDSLAQVRLARLQAIVALYQALGGGWDLAPRGGRL